MCECVCVCVCEFVFVYICKFFNVAGVPRSAVENLRVFIFLGYETQIDPSKLRLTHNTVTVQPIVEIQTH
jgi:hypothetical protein